MILSAVLLYVAGFVGLGWLTAKVIAIQDKGVVLAYVKLALLLVTALWVLAAYPLIVYVQSVF